MLADNANAYGGYLAAIGKPLDYATSVGLWLNLDRVDAREVYRGARSQWLARDTGDLDRAYVDASCPVEEEVDEILFRSNAERQRVRVLKKFGF